MAPKKKPEQVNKKAVNKQKEKVIEDRTFGLKNKKGKKQQQYVKNVTQQVKCGGNPIARKLAQDVDTKKSDQEKKKKEAEELNQLFRPVGTKLSKDADPKSVVCAYFKQGLCGKGDKCKYSHDLNLERKGEKRSLYVDSRDEDLQNDTMETWDQQKLEEVVEQKHGESEKKTSTEIVCKFFLEAIEKGLYGWFWTCPNGDNKCIYRHALPAGFVLKKKQEKEEKNEISLEELIEGERAKLGTTLTKITLETFSEWKKKKIKEKKESYERETKKKKEAFKTGRIVGKISGREVFQFRPELVANDDEEESFDMALYRTEEEEEDGGGTVVEISIDSFNSVAYNEPDMATPPNGTTIEQIINVESDGLDQACAISNDDKQLTIIPTIDGVPVEESLFEDLEGLDFDEVE